MHHLARHVTRHARAVVVATVVLVVAAALWGGGAIDRLTTGGNEVPGSDAAVAADLLAASGVPGPPDVVVLISTAEGDVTSSTDAARVASAVTELLAAHGVHVVASAWDADAAPQLVATDRSSGLVVGDLPGTDAEVQDRAAILAPALDRLVPEDGSVEVRLGGTGAVRSELESRTEADLDRAELLALPLTVLILLVVFRTPLAAGLPLVVAAVAIGGTLAALRLVLLVTDVSVYARNVMTALGLAMAVDVTLFLVARYREERVGAPDARAAVAAAVVGAGPSILFSGLTTAASLAGLLLFSTPILRSFAYGGVAVVLLALVGGLVVLPAVMCLLGDRIDRWPVRRSTPPADLTQGRWYRLAMATMRRPALVAAATTAALLVAALPLARVELGVNDDRVLPTGAEARQVSDVIRADYPGLEGGDVAVVLTQQPGPYEFDAYARRLAALDGVDRIEVADGWLRIVPSVEPVSAEGRALVRAIRAVDPPVEVVVGGEAARFTDNTDHVVDRLPLVLAFMVGVVALLLAVLFRSVVVVAKAIALNLLSLSVMFGSIVWIFQDGRLADTLGYSPTGLTDVTVPVLMFGIAFGLSMDYEVYLLARIRDEYVRTGATRASIARGLQRTGSVLSASAVLMAVVFLAFSTGSVTHLKVLGIGITIAVLVDAFVVRCLLVPSLMALAGRWNWWPSRLAAPEPVPDEPAAEELPTIEPVALEPLR